MSTTTTDRKIITIIGATGQQGTAVLLSLLRNPTYTLRGTTRTPASPAALALSSRGVQLFTADAATPGTFGPALAGAWGVFLNLSSQDPSLEHTEAAAGVALVSAIRAAGVKVLVHSSLPHTGGALRTFDAKAEIQRHAEALGFEAAAFVRPGWYMENFHFHELAGGFPFRALGEGGEYVLAYPAWGPAGARVPLIDVARDFGDVVHGVFKDPEKWDGKSVQAVSEELSYAEIVEGFEKVTGKRAVVQTVGVEEFPTMEVGYLEEMRKMFAWLQTPEVAGRYYGPGVENCVDQARELKEAATGMGLGSWEAWVEENVNPQLE
ncbi:NmrA family protein [Geopyxis carbonaria]|nr:NmrA family protein [Geopyxis carbonaria]